MKNIGYYNGKTGPIEEMTIPMDDRAVYFGDGVYEAAFTRHGKIFAVSDHINRFYNSCASVRIDFIMPKEELKTILLGLVAQVDSDCAGLYWQVSRGTALRSHIAPDPSKVHPNLLATVKPIPLPDFHNRITLMSYEDHRYEFCNIKTLNLLPNVLAATAAHDAGCDEAVFHRGDVVTECAHSNISILKDGAFISHPLDRFILPGTVRGQTIALCAKFGIPVIERTFTLDELRSADEAVITSAFGMIRSGKTLDGAPIGGKAPELLEKLQNAYRDRVIGETE